MKPLRAIFDDSKKGGISKLFFDWNIYIYIYIYKYQPSNKYRINKKKAYYY